MQIKTHFCDELFAFLTHFCDELLTNLTHFCDEQSFEHLQKPHCG